MGMILTEQEYEATKQRADEMRKRLDTKRKFLIEKGGLSEDQATCAMMGEETFLAEIQQEIGQYLVLLLDSIPEVERERLQLAVVLCRIASGKTQEEFAQIRGVSVEQVIRDERNEYYGTSEEDVRNLLGLLGYKIEAIIRYKLVRR